MSPILEKKTDEINASQKSLPNTHTYRRKQKETKFAETGKKKARQDPSQSPKPHKTRVHEHTLQSIDAGEASAEET